MEEKEGEEIGEGGVSLECVAAYSKKCTRCYAEPEAGGEIDETGVCPENGTRLYHISSGRHMSTRKEDRHGRESRVSLQETDTTISRQVLSNGLIIMVSCAKQLLM